MKTQPDSDLTIQSDPAHDRSSERLNFFLGTSLKIGIQDMLEARVRNLSAGGMMIEFREEPDLDAAPGDRVVAELRNIGRVKGVVAWVEGKRLGIRFDKAIDPAKARTPQGCAIVASGSGSPARCCQPGAANQPNFSFAMSLPSLRPACSRTIAVSSSRRP